MTMPFPVANMRVSREMKQAEYALDEALLRHSSLFASMVTARRETGMDPFAGHEGWDAGWVGRDLFGRDAPDRVARRDIFAGPEECVAGQQDGFDVEVVE